MGLREHEFDVAPELLAALARGTPGPLLDHAMVHGTNVAEAAAALREREANERVHGDVNSAEAAVEAALHGVEAAIGSVRDRGLFDGTSVSGGLPGGPGQDGRGTNGPGDLGPGRGAGRIGIGKHGFVRGSTVFDFLAGQATSGAGRVGKDVPTVNPMQAAIDALNLHNKIYQRAEVARRGDPESAELRRAEDRAFELARRAVREVVPVGSTRLPRELWPFVSSTVIQYIMRETPNPDGNADDTQSPIHTLFVLQDIASGGGLTDIAMDGTSSGAARRPAILNAIDGSDDSEYNKLTISTAVKWWGMNLIDPIPE